MYVCIGFDLYPGLFQCVHIAAFPILQTVGDFEEEEEDAPEAELCRNGDHTIVIDERALHHIEEMDEQTSYFTTNLVVKDIEVRFQLALVALISS